jgi:hypothetical protein
MPQGSLAAAAVDSLECCAIRVEDFDAYVKIVAPEEIALDLDEIGDRLGRSLTMGEFLGALSSYTGRVVLSERRVTICSDLPGLLPRSR